MVPTSQLLCKIFQKRCLAFHANNYHCLYLIRLTHYKPLNHLRMCILAVCLRAFSTEVSVAIRFSWCASSTTSTGTAKIFTRMSSKRLRMSNSPLLLACRRRCIGVGASAHCCWLCGSSILLEAVQRCIARDRWLTPSERNPFMCLAITVIA